jgi:putative efflux protein, MATE family
MYCFYRPKARQTAIEQILPWWYKYTRKGWNMNQNIDMTKGSIRGNLIAFAIPLFLGNLFQQLYNTMDSIIVGNILGAEALASVASSGSLIFMLIGFINGVAIGAGVVISKNFGMRNEAGMRKAIHTDLAFGLLAGTLVSLFAVFFTPSILRLMKTPENIMAGSVTYFKIYSFGLFFSVLYNNMMGIMNAVGDSRHPLYYLIFSSVLNVLLDLLFIGVLGMGVGGAAAATIISQGLSVTLSFCRLLRKDTLYAVRISEIRLDKYYLSQIIRFGVPAGIQNSVIGFANTVVQTNINTFSSFAVAASGAYSKIEGFAFMPITSFSMGLTTFIGQNLGASEYKRAKKGAVFGILCSITLAELIGVVIYIFGPNLIALFNNDPKVVAFGTRQCRIEGLFFFALALSHCIAGILRGSGKAKVPMFIMLSVWCVLRITYITITVNLFHNIAFVYSAYPVTWCVSSVIFVIYLLSSNWLHGLDEKRD